MAGADGGTSERSVLCQGAGRVGKGARRLDAGCAEGPLPGVPRDPSRVTRCRADPASMADEVRQSTSPTAAASDVTRRTSRVGRHALVRVSHRRHVGPLPRHALLRPAGLDGGRGAPVRVAHRRRVGPLPRQALPRPPRHESSRAIAGSRASQQQRWLTILETLHTAIQRSSLEPSDYNRYFKICPYMVREICDIRCASKRAEHYLHQAKVRLPFCHHTMTLKGRPPLL